MEVEMLNNLNIKCKLCGCTEVELQDYKIRNITDDSCKMYKCKNNTYITANPHYTKIIEI